MVSTVWPEITVASITIRHHSGVVAAELAQRAGHSKPSMSLDVYAGAMPVAEATEPQLRPRLEA